MDYYIKRRIISVIEASGYFTNLLILGSSISSTSNLYLVLPSVRYMYRYMHRIDLISLITNDIVEEIFYFPISSLFMVPFDEWYCHFIFHFDSHDKIEICVMISKKSSRFSWTHAET